MGLDASKDPREEIVILRAPYLRPSKDIFWSVREGRRLGVDTPSDKRLHPVRLYALFHDYNVESMGDLIKYTRRPQRRHTLPIDFYRVGEADQVVHVLDAVKFKGMTMEVRKWQIPMKYFGGTSWDGGRKGGHRSGRDQGNAVGTNFEYVSL